MKYDYLKAIPVGKRPKMLAIWGGEYFRDWKKAIYFVALSLPALVSAAWNGFALSRWASAGCGFIGCQFILFSGFVTVCSGMASSNWGTFFRETEPVRFWLDIGMRVFGYGLIMAGMWLVR